mmetsp:Transcript_55141/g.133974  ORF Transcript_55141/g.133974 Transcript_55141/m.133974 type:complete len:654 (+) Transcript_55141:257-2218(+)
MEWPNINIETFQFATVSTEIQIWKRAAKVLYSDISLSPPSPGSGNVSYEELKERVRQFLESLEDVEKKGRGPNGEEPSQVNIEEQETYWKSNYRTILAKFVEIMASAPSPEHILDAAQAGIDAVHDLLLYRIDHRTVVPSKDVFMLTKSFQAFKSKTVMGTAPPDLDFQFGIDNPAKASSSLSSSRETQHLLYGMDAVRQIDAWYKYGVMETSASCLAKATIMTQNIPQQVSSKVFVLLGCTSALGPAKPLLRIPGVRMLGVARGGAKLDSLIDFVKTQAPDDTSFMYPKVPDDEKDEADYPNGGACIIKDGPRIAQWILNETDSKKDEIVIVPLATSEDGEEHLRLSASMDLIIQRILRSRPKSALWTYNSPTMPLIVPPMAATSAQQRLTERPTWERWANTLTRGSWLTPSTLKYAAAQTASADSGTNGEEGSSGDDANDADEGPKPNIFVNNNDYVLVNGLVTAQGPCYVLAKTLQQWRCMVAYYRDSQIASCPYAPLTRTPTATSTDGIMTNALSGMHHFEPLLAFDAGPASTLMCSILVAQLQLMNRPLPDMEESPYTLFWDGSCHGGVWTCPYTLESISTLNYAMGKSTYYPHDYVPPASLADLTEAGNIDGEYDKKKFNPDVLLTLTDAEDGKPMPDIVQERLDFM